MTRTVIVVSGGDPPAPDAARGLPADAYVIAADSGLDHAARLGLQVDLVIGDMDSVSPEALARAEGEGRTEIEAHPAAKDQTDLELALARAVALGPDRIVVLGGDAGRLDHLVGGILILASERYAAVPITARLGPATLSVIRSGRGAVELRGRPDDLVTLLPVGAAARGVTTEGLLYPLKDEDLPAGTGRGISNRFLGDRAAVRVEHGVLVALQPGPWT